MSFLRRVTSAPTDPGRSKTAEESERDRRKEMERKELLEMVLESIANVPKAVERIHTNEKLRNALHQEMGDESTLLHRFFDAKQQGEVTLRGSLSEGKRSSWNLGRRAVSDEEEEPDDSPLPARPATSLGIYDNYKHSQEEDKDADSDRSEDSSSDYGEEYENDLAEAVNQLCMTDDTLTAMDDMISDPIGIVHTSFAGSSARISSSPQSSFGLGASPGTTSMDGEPVSALWPRQPNQFAFTQEEDNNVRAEDEVYSEMVSSVCEDDTFPDDVDGEEEEESPGHEAETKLFDMDDEEEEEEGEGLGTGVTHFSNGGPMPGEFVVGSPVEGQVTTFQNDLDGKSKQKPDVVHTVDIKGGEDVCDEEGSQGSHDDEDEDGEPKEYEVFQLRIIREKNRTGFEPNQDWRPRAGTLIGNRYKVRCRCGGRALAGAATNLSSSCPAQVEMAIGEAVFSRTYKCVDTSTEQAVCLKIIKNNKEYFDQGVDEIRVLEYIDHHCKVDERHLVRLLDSFYFREHLIIVTEVRLGRVGLCCVALRAPSHSMCMCTASPRQPLRVLSPAPAARSDQLLQHPSPQKDHDRGAGGAGDAARDGRRALRPQAREHSHPELQRVHRQGDRLRVRVLHHRRAHVLRAVALVSSPRGMLLLAVPRAGLESDGLLASLPSSSQVILGLLYDTKIDLWSLGCVVAEMFTGEVLFRNDSEQTLLARIMATIGACCACLAARPSPSLTGVLCTLIQGRSPRLCWPSGTTCRRSSQTRASSPRTSWATAC
jgi:hypothetical protein